MVKLVKLTLELRNDTIQELKRIKEEEGRNIKSIIQKALDEYLQNEDNEIAI